jgi:hypothetical protein
MDVKTEISWGKAILYSFIPGVVSFIFFLLLEIIWGDILNQMLHEQYQIAQYANVTLIIWVGLIFVVAASITVNITLYKEYRFGPRIMVNLFATLGMLSILFFISWLTILVQYKQMYLQMNLEEELYFLPLVYSFFAIYTLPNPVWFWVLAFIIYHILLAILIKLLFIRK